MPVEHGEGGMSGSAEMTGADALVESLALHGIDRIFALPGAQIDHFFCSLYDRPGEFDLITSRHEQGAAYMALGAARSTGRPQVYAVVPGPGWLNASGALATAYGCNAPVLCLSGQIPSASIGRGIGELHELPDQLAMARGITKWAARADTPAAASPLVASAFREMATGRPRPTHIEMAPDIMGRREEVALSAPDFVSESAVDADAVTRAAAVITGAERPVIFVGGGAQHASAEVLALAERLQAPVVSFRSGRGVIDDRNALAQPYLSGHDFWAAADVAIAIGTRLDFPRRMWGEDAGLKIVRIDIDPEEIERVSVPATAVVGDAQTTIRALLAELPSGARPSRMDELARAKAAAVARFDTEMTPQMQFLRAIRAALPENGFFVDELTQVGYASWSWFPTYEPRHFISSGYQGTLGYGFPTALGVKAANRDAPVVSVTGDGGFLFGLTELATAVQHKLNLVTIVFRDNKFGNVQRIQRERYAGKVIGSDLHNPDFVALAHSFGAAGHRCLDAASLQHSVATALADERPTVIEVPVGDLPSPWPFIVLPRVRGLGG